MRVLLPLVLIVLIILVAMSIYAVILRRRLKGLENPVLWLPRKERRAHARELLKRAREEYELDRQQDLVEAIRTELRPHFEKDVS